MGQLVLVVFIVGVYLFRIGQVPTGLFCDEAEIGLMAHRLLRGEFGPFFVAPFFYRHFEYTLGLLPVASLVPVIALIGLNALAVRLAAVLSVMAAAWFLWLVLKKFSVGSPIPMLLMLFAPMFWLISHIQFGHAESMLLMAFGLYAFWQYFENQLWPWAIISAIAFGFSCYGYLGFVLGTPLLVVCLLLGKMIQKNYKKKTLFQDMLFLIVFLIMLLPISYKTLINSDFSKRLIDKNGGEQFDFTKKIPEMLENYSKYFSYDYLFAKAEYELPGGFISRHGIKGHGIYLRSFLPLLVLGWVGLLFVKDKEKSRYQPFFWFWLLTPIPDLLTTKSDVPPYSFSLYFGLMAVPFMAAYGLHVFELLTSSLVFRRRLLIGGYVLFLGLEIGGLLKDYFVDYPTYSADYWGWQMGPKQIIDYFSAHQQDYDELLLTGYFNQPQALLNFYSITSPCDRCVIGGVANDYKQGKRQLFALRESELSELQRPYKVVELITLPSGKVEYELIEIIE